MSDSPNSGPHNPESADSPPEPNTGVPVIKIDTSSSRAAKGQRTKTRKKGRRDSGTFDASVLAGVDPVKSPATIDLKDEIPTATVLGSDEESNAPEIISDEPIAEAAVPVIDTTRAKAASRKPTLTKGKTSVENRDRNSRATAPTIQIDIDSAAKADAAKTAGNSTETPVGSPITIDTSKDEKIKRVTTRPTAVKSGSGKTRTAKTSPAKHQKKSAIPPTWIAVGAGGGTALIVIVLLIGLLSGPADEPSPSGGRRGASGTSPGARTMSLPTFESDIPTSGSGTGVRAMDAEEIARRREGMSSFAEMGREEEAKLRGQPAKKSPKSP